MSIRPPTLGTLVVVAFLLIGAAACGNGRTSVSDPLGAPGSDATEPSSEAPCEATATVNGATYHVVRVVSRNYGLNPTVQVEGSATDCSGDSGEAMTFHAIPHVDPAEALCGLVDGKWRLFLADDIGPVPANSPLARIVVGY
jgi:hypothetical protein